MDKLDWNSIWNTILGWVMNTGIKIVIAIVLLIVSFLIINAISKSIKKKLDKKNKLDKTLTKVIFNAIKVAAKCLVVVCLIGYLGIDTSALSAVIASLGVCIGLAVNGALANIAGGVLLLVTRPFRVDDYVQVAGQEGVIEDIRLCNTVIRTLDNKLVFVPNSAASP